MRSHVVEFTNLNTSNIQNLIETVIELPEIDEIIFLCVTFENDNAFNTLFDSIFKNKKIRGISLQNIDLTSNMCETIRRFIQKVEEVKIDYCRLTPEANFSLTSKDSISLRHLSLSYLKATPSQLEQAIDSIRFFPLISSLNLSGLHLNHLVASISELLKCTSKLILLNLSATVSNETFLPELSNIIANHQKLILVIADAAVTTKYVNLPEYFLDVIKANPLSKKCYFSPKQSGVATLFSFSDTSTQHESDAPQLSYPCST